MNELTETEQLTSSERYKLDMAEEGINASNLELCRVMAEMPDKQVAIAEYTGRGKSAISRMIAVGAAYEKFHTMKHLPEGWGSLYLMSDLSKTQIKQLCKDRPPTQKEIKEYKIELGLLDAPPEKVKFTISELHDAAFDRMFDLAGLNEYALRAIADSKKQIIKMMDGMGKMLSRDAEKLIVEVFKHNSTFFNRELAKKVKGQVKEKQIELDQREKDLMDRERQLVNGIPEKDKKYVYGVLHPDKAPKGLEAKYAKAFDVVRKWH